MRIRVAGLLIVDNAVLMVQHVKEQKAYWLLPGGGVKLGEETKSALQREIKEELHRRGSAVCC